MSVFERCFVFIRSPEGGAYDLARLKVAGFEGIFCNVGDYTDTQWNAVRERAQEAGVVCGPWLRTADEHNRFDPQRLDRLIAIADDWQSPLVVNSESELKGSGQALTREIADAVGEREAAVSMECWPFANVEWWPIGHLPVLPQIFPVESDAADDPEACKQMWHAYGIRCVYHTFGTYAGMVPADFKLQAPYSLYTLDDVGPQYDLWSPTSTGYEGCVEQPPLPEDSMEKIGKQHGITGFANWLRAQPDAPARGTGYDPEDVDTWPWPDKLERTLNILAADHDETASVFDGPE